MRQDSAADRQARGRARSGLVAVLAALASWVALFLGWLVWRTHVEGPPVDGVHLFQVSMLLALLAAVLGARFAPAVAVLAGASWAAYALAWFEVPPRLAVLGVAVLGLALVVLPQRWARPTGVALLVTVGVALLTIV